MENKKLKQLMETHNIYLNGVLVKDIEELKEVKKTDELDFVRKVSKIYLKINIEL